MVKRARAWDISTGGLPGPVPKAFLLAALLLAGTGSAAVAAGATCGGAAVQTEVPRGTPYSDRLADKAAVLPPDTRALIFGDSDAGRWPADQLDHLFGTPVLNFAQGGDRFENTRWMIDQVDAPAARAVSSVVVMVGSNSVNRDDPCSLEAKARDLLRSLKPRFPAARVYFVNILQKGRVEGRMSDRVLAANDVLRELSAEFGLTYVDVHGAFAAECGEATDCPLFAEDRVHPSAAGFDLMSRVLARALQPKPG
ncbi:Lysophospholipase L1 [Faunimonas pinastri]|uniref:Lysophospholipase L1 n=1 Tax=Faunimonas pinastri TaxID=1855383 RepID=A0A1H9FGI9_9HYPH|nr:SGNH/GDSL hydrolase family protein [Faunimonas pinastri]SEQ37044.1 Lysophospholipase L1 [Faunimonas pinastri]